VRQSLRTEKRPVDDKLQVAPSLPPFLPPYLVVRREVLMLPQRRHGLLEILLQTSRRGVVR